MSFHVYSDDEESPVLQDFVNETLARQTETPSPRTELLSPPRTSPRALQGEEIDRLRRGRRGPSERYRRQREEAYANVSSRQLLSLFIEKEYESSKLRKALHRAFERFEAEAIRVSEAERVTQETLNQFRAINEAKVAAERALSKTNEELRLWKFQFDHAQKEIERAQDVVRLVERQRDDAERAAAKARTAARQLNEQRLVNDALEEGRRLGYQAGFRRAQQEMAYTRVGEPYEDLEREMGGHGRVYSAVDVHDSGLDGSPSQPPRDINASPMPAPHSPQIIRMPEILPSPHQPPPTHEAPSPSPAMAMPSPIPAPPPRTFETEPVRHAPSSVRSPSIQLSRYSIDIPSPSVLDQTRPSDYQPQQQRRPSSQAPRPRSVQDAPPTRPNPQEQPQYQPPPPAKPPPDNYIPSASAEGGIPLPPPFQLSRPVLPAVDAPRTQSWYNRDRPEEPAPAESWYQPKRPRSNAGSATGRSNAGSVTGRSAQGRHTRHTSLDSRVPHGNGKLVVHEYGTDLGAIKEDARSAQGTYAYTVPEQRWDNAQGSQRARSMRGSVESLVPPPPPEKDARHQKQAIADELRYSNPDLPEAWRRDAAANAGTGSSRSGPPRNVRRPAQLTMPTPLSPPTGPVPLAGHMRARTMSGSTGKSGRSQPPNPVDLANRPSLRRVKERRPISPSDVGSPFSGTINVEPPSQSSSQIPLQMNIMPQIDQYLSPNYQTQPLPNQSALPSGFMPQMVTVPAEVTLPVTYNSKSISSPISFPAGGGGADNAQPRPTSGLNDYRVPAFDGNTNLNRPRSTSMHTPSRAAEPLPLARPLSAISTSNLSRKSGKSGKAEYVAGPNLTAGHTLAHQASNTSLRSTGSGYARFDANSYVDPAYFAADTSGAIPVPAPRSRRGSASSHSGLSYMGPPLP